MAYGDDITEGLPYALSNPDGIVSYAQNSENYDIALGGLPFFLTTSDLTPYRRQTAQYRKQQIDQSSEPGEQSITGWWVRAQSSFHSGSGINFYDPSAGETIPYRFADSKGVNVWEKGKVTLLKNTSVGHEVTSPILSNGRIQQHLRSIEWNGSTGVLMHDGYDVDKIPTSAPGTPIHFIDYNSGTDSKVYAICDDGTFAYWITNTTTKKTVYKKPLTGTSSVTSDVVKMFDEAGTISNATMEYVKDRIVLCADNKVYEFSTSAVAMPTAVYTHPTATHTYTSVAASGPAIYIAGYNGIQSTIQKFTLATNGTMPTLTSAIVAAELPVGEVVHVIKYYLGYLLIGTNKGVRVASISETDGSLNYGPLFVETTQPCYDFAMRDKYAWCATSVNGSPGVIRIDLSNEIEQLSFAWANDIYYDGVTGHQTTACAFMDGTERLAFTTSYANSSNGAVYVEDATTLVPEGYITTGKIRYSTLEKKIFKTLNTIVDNTYGDIVIQSIDKNNTAYTIGSFAESDFTPEVNISYPVGAQEYLSFKFTIKRFSADSSKCPVISGFQLKAIPAIQRQRLIQLPLACFDIEKDSLGNQVGHEGSAYDRLLDLEHLENNGDTIRIEDFRTDETYLGIIEELQFINSTPTDKRFSGFGGILLATIRTI